MSAQEFFSGGLPAPLRRRFDPVVLQDIRDGAATDSVPQIGQRPKHPPIAPVPIFRCQAHHQGLDLTESAGSTGTPFLAAIVFLSDQPPMPSQKRFWRDDRRDFPKNASPEPLRLGRQTSTLIVVQPEAPVAQLLSEYSVFLPQGSRSRHAAADPTIQRPKSGVPGRDRRSGTLRQDTKLSERNGRCKLPGLNQIEFLDTTGWAAPSLHVA